MNKLRPLLTSLYLTSAFTNSLVFAQEKVPAHIHGTVFDANHAVVANVRLRFEADGGGREVDTNEEGIYEIDLPGGLYRVKTSVIGFCSVERAAFNARPATDTMINLTLVVCPIANILKYDSKKHYLGEECRYIDPFSSETFSLIDASGLNRQLLIRYGTRKVHKGENEYTGVKEMNGVPPSVVVSFDVNTITADKVVFNRRKGLLQAEGQVTVEDGKQRTNYIKIELKLKTSAPMVNFKAVPYS